MTRQRVLEALRKAIGQVRQNMGLPLPELDESACPFVDLPEFDSPQELDVIVLFEEILDVDVGLDRLFADGEELHSIGQAADLLVRVLGAGVESNG